MVASRQLKQFAISVLLAVVGALWYVFLAIAGVLLLTSSFVIGLFPGAIARIQRNRSLS